MSEKDKMRCLPELDRPYERIEKYGTKTLTDSELLAVIIKTGTKNKNAVGVARTLLNSFGEDVSAVCNANLAELKSIKGIGTVKALQLKACGELARRISKGTLSKSFSAKNISALGTFLINDFRGMKQEIFRIMLLNSRFKIVKEKDVSLGTVDKAIVHPREVFREAIKDSCTYIVLVHNHPSGDELPGTDDFNTTKALVKAGLILGIYVYDHLVIGENAYYSMRENGDIDRIERDARQCGSVAV